MKTPRTKPRKPKSLPKRAVPKAKPQRKRASAKPTEAQRTGNLDRQQLNVERGGERMPTDAETESAGSRAFPIEIDPKSIEGSLLKIRDEVQHWANKGRYTRVRFKFRGKQLLPDLPLAAVVAVEGLSFYWAGILRALLVTVGAGALLDVELVNDSEKKIAEGKAALLGGDVDKALEYFQKAAAMQRDNAHAQLNIGVALKLKGDRPGARAALEQARELDRDGPVGAEAERLLTTVPAETEQTPVQITYFPPPQS